MKYVDANLDEPDKAISGNEPYKPKSNNGMCQKQAYNVFSFMEIQDKIIHNMQLVDCCSELCP